MVIRSFLAVHPMPTSVSIEACVAEVADKLELKPIIVTDRDILVLEPYILGAALVDVHFAHVLLPVLVNEQCGRLRHQGFICQLRGLR